MHMNALPSHTPPFICILLTVLIPILPFLKKPFYVTSTLDSVIYNFKNLRPDTYEIIAIKDVGGNYLFDQNIDKIGFLEKPITLPGDSVINFRIFKEIPNQFWTRPFFINTNQIGFGYYGEADRDAIEVKSKVPRNFRYLINKNRETDTLTFGLEEINLDSLKFAIKEKDTTRLFNVKFKKELRDSLEISVITKSTMGLLDSFKIQSNLPLVKINLDLIKIKGLDSLSVPFKAHWIKTTIDYLYFTTGFPNDNYKIELLSQCFDRFWGNTHDTLSFSVKTKPIEDYGNIFLQIIRQDKDPFVLELVNLEGDKLEKVDVSNEFDFYEFKYLLPGNYLFRYIKDKNGNKKWDTGNYLKKFNLKWFFTRRIQLI